MHKLMKLFYKVPVLSITLITCLARWTSRVRWAALVCLAVSANVHATVHGPVTFAYFEDAQGAVAGIDDPLQALAVFESQDKRFDIRRSDTPFNIGNVDKTFWFHTRIVNPGSDTVTRRLIAVVPYRPLLAGFLLDTQAGKIPLIQYSYTSTFNEREENTDVYASWPHRWLTSAPFDVPTGQAVDVLVKYHADGSSYIPLDVVDELELVRHIHNDNVSAVLFYSFSVASILLFLLFGIAMQDRTARLYAGLFALALLMLAANEGFAFMLLWPQWPGWNQYSALVLVYLFSAFGFYVAENAAEPSRKLSALSPVISRSLRLLAVISVIMAAMVPVMPAVFMTDASNLFVVLMFSAHAYAIYSWSKIDRGELNVRGDTGRLLRRNLITIIAAVLIASLVLVLVVMSFDPDLLSPYILVHANRLVFILAGLATMATIISHVSGLRQDYAESLENQVAAAEREAQMSRELLQAEQRYNKVRALASLRQQQLAEASHDMKQPLVSLRSTLDTLTAEYSAEVKQQLSNAFSYLENLCANYLASSRPDAGGIEDDGYDAEESTADDDFEQADTGNGGDKERYEISLVLQTVYRMFEADAGNRGVDLRMQPSSLEITATPTVVIRIVANIVSNAIKHSQASRILIGVRRRQHSAEIIIADDGKGMSQQELNRITQAYQKGPDSSGEGLGMAISKQLAEQNGMQLNIDSAEGRGSCFRLELDR